MARKKKTTREFVDEAKRKHGDRYDYCNTSYLGALKKLEIICRVCDTGFYQQASAHLRGQGCPHCFGNQNKGSDGFVQEAIAAHGSERFDYSRVEYLNNKGKIEIGCIACGEWFWQEASAHLRGQGCPFCARQKRTSTKEEFVGKALLAQEKNSYDYSRVQYINALKKVEIGCNTCGEWFWQTPHAHLGGQGCPFCFGKLNKGLEGFLEDAIAVHGESRYDYSRVQYVKAIVKVDIGCNKCGDRFWQTPHAHLKGHGCPACADYGFQLDKPGILYYIRFTLPSGDFLYKIGITNLTVQERFRAEPLPYTILKETPYLFGFLARDREQELLEQHKQYRYRGDALVSGNTEAFTRDILGLDGAIAVSA